MAIDKIMPPNDPSRLTDGVKSGTRPGGGEDTRIAPAESKGDRVDISNRSREVHQIRQQLELTPDVRTDKVEAAKQAIESNLYNVRGEQIADRMIGALLNSLG